MSPEWQGRLDALGDATTKVSPRTPKEVLISTAFGMPNSLTMVLDPKVFAKDRPPSPAKARTSPSRADHGGKSSQPADVCHIAPDFCVVP